MTLKEQIVAEVKVAMKSQDKERLETLRFVHAAIKNKEIDMRPAPLTDTETLAVLKQLVKKHKDSLEQYRTAGRDELANKEASQLLVVEKFLPEQMGREEVEKLVNQAISKCNATSMKDMKSVMAAVLEEAKGSADNRVVSELVRSQLQQN